MLNETEFVFHFECFGDKKITVSQVQDNCSVQLNADELWDGDPNEALMVNIPIGIARKVAEALIQAADIAEEYVKENGNGPI